MKIEERMVNDKEKVFQLRKPLPLTIHIPFIQLKLYCLLLLLISCAQKNNKPGAHYPVDSLVQAQIKYLAQRKASVKKVSMLGDKESKSSFMPPDTSAWIKELDIFRNLDVINKPVNRDLYTVEDGLKDPKSNLKIKVFKSKEELPVEYLKIYYQNKLPNVRRIESKYNESNSMYAGTRYLIMEFEDINDKSVLTYYSVYGGQKMFLGDSVSYTINASVVYEQ